MVTGGHESDDNSAPLSPEAKSLETLEHEFATDAEMQQRAKVLFENLQMINARINAAKSGAGLSRRGGTEVSLIAVSKLKPASDILALHKSGQVHFGENYAQELQAKHTLLPPSIAWHFIGGLQTNACKRIAKIPNLHSVHSIDTLKKAQAHSERRDPQHSPINAYIQINTSGEESKSGLSPSSRELLETAQGIINDCKGLKLVGLMTIGALARSKSSENENEDFEKLVKEAEGLEEKLGWENGTLLLSMGMSEDFELAISIGASCVRVGSSIFGQRPKKEDAVI